MRSNTSSSDNRPLRTRNLYTCTFPGIYRGDIAQVIYRHSFVCVSYCVVTSDAIRPNILSRKDKLRILEGGLTHKKASLESSRRGCFEDPSFGAVRRAQVYHQVPIFTIKESYLLEKRVGRRGPLYSGVTTEISQSCSEQGQPQDGARMYHATEPFETPLDLVQWTRYPPDSFTVLKGHEIAIKNAGNIR